MRVKKRVGSTSTTSRFVLSFLGFFFILLGIFLVLNSIQRIQGLAVLTEEGKPIYAPLGVFLFFIGIFFLKESRREIRAQAAMEFLMTYGWAILAAIIVISALSFYIGGSLLSPQPLCIVTSPFYCEGYIFEGGLLKLEVTNNGYESLRVKGYSINSEQFSCDPITGLNLPVSNGESTVLTFNVCTGVEEGETFSGDIRIEFSPPDSSLTQEATGTVAGDAYESTLIEGECGDTVDDGDGLCSDVDNCPLVSNADQSDLDNDGIGDACDGCTTFDEDSDGVNIVLCSPPACELSAMCLSDNCPTTSNVDQSDQDSDGIGDVCDDSDGDTIFDAADNCIDVSNPTQGDLDGDGQGNICDFCTDVDGDGKGQNCPDCVMACLLDNCVNDYNPDQNDTDQDGVGDVCDFTLLGYYRVFITSTTQNGNLGGVLGADAICNARADASNITGLGNTNWKAWLSEGGAAMSANNRLYHSTIPYKLVDNRTVAVGWNDLTNGDLQRQINLTEDGVMVTTGATWTGTNYTALHTSNDCLGWTTSSNSSTGDRGAANNVSFTGAWSYYSALPCDQLLRLYCFEQP